MKKKTEGCDDPIVPSLEDEQLPIQTFVGVEPPPPHSHPFGFCLWDGGRDSKIKKIELIAQKVQFKMILIGEQILALRVKKCGCFLICKASDKRGFFCAKIRAE